MWSFASNAIGSFVLNNKSIEPSRTCSESSDDDLCSNISREEGLECPICWESFNIVENVPYVLWCGHTLCQNCVLGLQSAFLRFPSQAIKIPFFISCPWCNLLSLRVVYKGNIKFPCKNFFLLWMVESLHGDRVKFESSACEDNHQPVWSPKCHPPLGNRANDGVVRPISHNHFAGQSESRRDGVSSSSVGRHHQSLHKSLDFFIHFSSKFPLVFILLLIIFFAIPGSVFILVLYLLLTMLFAIPSFLVLYFAYPTLDRLVREITS